MAHEPVIIPVSKGKIVLHLIGSVTFVLLGIWILVSKPDVSNSVLNNPVVKYGAGIASILFFGLAAVLLFGKLWDTKPGLVIDEKGITDNSSGVSAGFIPWGDVTHIFTAQVMSQKFIMVGVSNPEEYIGHQKQYLKKKAMNYNFKNYGSPISIGANGLTTDFDSLLAIMNTMWAASKNNIT